MTSTGVTTKAAGSDSQTGAAPQSGIDRLADKETFLKLLVAQIRNQNPMNPADGIQFLTQLAQFSQLEQMMQIRSDLESIKEAVAPQQTGGAA